MKRNRTELKTYCIFVPEGGQSALYGASLLQKYFSICTETELPILNRTPEEGEQGFVLGAASKRQAELHDHGFHIYRKGMLWHFCGDRDRGLLYAVCEFVERVLGVRFLTASSEYTPKSDEIDLPEDIFSCPDIGRRTFLTGSVYAHLTDPDFAVKCRNLGYFTQYDETHGGQDCVFGRGNVHNFHLYVPFTTWGNDHPEFYRFMYVNGSIHPTIDITNGITDDGKLDESMDVSVAKIVIEELKKEIDARPNVEVFNFTQEDGPYYYDSERNRFFEATYKRSGILIRFCNVVIRALNDYVRETYPGRVVKLITFAYDYTATPPVRYENGKPLPIDDTVVADENLIIQMAFFSNGYYYYFSGYDRAVLNQIEGWAAVAKRFWFWMYDINYRSYLHFFDSFHNIKANVEGFKKIGVEYLLVQSSHDSVNNWQSNMRGYAYNKLMWDTSRSADALLGEYADLFYGPASGAVMDMIALFHRHYSTLVENGTDLMFGTRGNHEHVQNNPLSLLLHAIAILEEGEKKICSADLTAEEKHTYLGRLAQVKATPVLMIFEHYLEYYPDRTEADRKAWGDYLKSLCEMGDMMKDCSGENWSLERYFNGNYLL